MTDAQIVNFAARLSTGQLEPAEMVGLSIDDFRKLLDHLGKHREWLLQQYVNSILASRTGQTYDGDSGEHIYMEEQMLAERGTRVE